MVHDTPGEQLELELFEVIGAITQSRVREQLLKETCELFEGLGAAGSGKSTMAQLIRNFYPPTCVNIETLG